MQRHAADRRYGVTVTKHISTGDGPVGAWDPSLSGRLELGDDSVGFELPNVLTPGQTTVTTSQRLTGQDIQKYLQDLSQQNVTGDEFLNAMAKHIQELEASGAHEDILEQWHEQYETLVDQLTTDPIDITRDDPWTQEGTQEEAPKATTSEEANEAHEGETSAASELEEHTWYGDVREWLSEKLSLDISMPEQDPNFLPWIGSEAFVQLGIDQKIEDGSWLTFTADEREGYIQSRAEEYRMQLDIAVNMNMLTKIPGAIARAGGKFTTWVMDKLGARKAVANDTGQFVTDVGEWVGFGYASAILKEVKLVGKVVEGMPLKVYRKNVKITLPSGETKIINKIYKVEYCQIHHILSDKNPLTKNHDLLKAAGFDLNDTMNKMILPTVEGAKRSTTLKSIHQSKHVEKYSRDLAKKMDDIYELGVRKGWNQGQYRKELENIIIQTRKELKLGKVHLNKHTREAHGLPLAGE